MSESKQWQCPNCGGYKVGYRAEPISEKVPITFATKIGVFIGWFITLFPLAIGCLLPLFFVLLLQDDAWMILILAIAGVIGGIIALRMVSDVKFTAGDKIGTLYFFHCNICGFEWRWDDRTPYPKINVRPNLIVAGEQQLREEEARRQEEERRQRDMAYLHQRFNKK